MNLDLNEVLGRIFDRYTIVARIFPSILTLVPFFILWYFIRKDAEYLNFENYITNLKLVGSLSISLIVIYLHSLIIRQVSKYYERKFFLNADGFPSTYIMTYEDNTFSDDFKDRYRAKAKSLLDISLLSKDEEKANATEAKKRLNEATKQVILKVRDGQLVKSHNIWYGFFRNLIGGCILACVFCLLNIVIGYYISRHLIIISSVLFVLYLLILIFKKSIMISTGEDYAKQLISEFMQSSVSE